MHTGVCVDQHATISLTIRHFSNVSKLFEPPKYMQPDKTAFARSETSHYYKE